jgi:hypothetical protein
MSFSCPVAPAGPAPLSVRATELARGRILFRFYKTAGHPANSFNPNTGKRIEIPEDGARFNPFPGAPSINVPTLYAADVLQAAALESVFHEAEHVPSPTYLKSQFAEWSYCKLRTKRKLVFLKLINPRLRPLTVPGRGSSITESELIHTPPSEYPHTRTWARYLHDNLQKIDGLAWRPRLGGTGTAYVFFGDRCGGALSIDGSAVSIASGPGLGKVSVIARNAGIVLIDP